MDHGQRSHCIYIACLMLVYTTYCYSIPVEEVSKINNTFGDSVVNEFSMNREAYIHHISNDKKKMASIYVNHGPFDYELICQQEVSTGPNDLPNKRSTCPWYYSVDHNPRRYPATIMKAERLCEYSRGSNNSLECVPVTQKLPVLELQNYRDNNGNYVWTNTMVTVVTGYTSAARRRFYTSG